MTNKVWFRSQIEKVFAVNDDYIEESIIPRKKQVSARDIVPQLACSVLSCSIILGQGLRRGTSISK